MGRHKNTYYLKLVKNPTAGFRVGEAYYKIEHSGGLHYHGDMTSSDVRFEEHLLVYAQERILEKARNEGGKFPNKLELKLSVKI